MERPQIAKMGETNPHVEWTDEENGPSKKFNAMRETDQQKSESEVRMAVANGMRSRNGKKERCRGEMIKGNNHKGFVQSGSEHCLEAYFGSIGNHMGDEEQMYGGKQRKRSQSGQRSNLQSQRESQLKQRGRRMSARDQTLRSNCPSQLDPTLYNSRTPMEGENGLEESIYNVRKSVGGRKKYRATGKENRPNRVHTEVGQRRSVKNGKSQDEHSRNSRSGSRYQRGFALGRGIRLGKGKIRPGYAGMNFHNVSGKNSKYSGVIPPSGFPMGHSVKAIGGYQSHRGAGKNFFEYNGSGQRKIRMETETGIEKMPVSKQKRGENRESKEKRQLSKGGSWRGGRRDGLQSFFQNLELRSKKGMGKGIRGGYGMGKKGQQLGYCGYGSETGHGRKSSKGSRHRKSVQAKQRIPDKTGKLRQRAESNGGQNNLKDHPSANNSLKRKNSSTKRSTLATRKNSRNNRPKNIPNFRDIKNLAGKTMNCEPKNKNKKSSKNNSRRKGGSEILASLVGGTGRLLTSGGRPKWHGASRRKMSGILSQKERMFETIYKEKMRPDSKNNVGRRKGPKAGNRWGEKPDPKCREKYPPKGFAKNLQNQAPSLGHLYTQEEEGSRQIESVQVMETCGQNGIPPKFTSLCHLQPETAGAKRNQNSWKGIHNTGAQAGKFNIPKSRGAREGRNIKKSGIRGVSTRDTKTRREGSRNDLGQVNRDNEVKISSFFKGNNHVEGAGRIREETPDVCSRVNNCNIAPKENFNQIEKDFRESDDHPSKMCENLDKSCDPLEIEEEEDESDTSEVIEEETQEDQKQEESGQGANQPPVLGDITIGYQNLKNRNRHKSRSHRPIMGKENLQPNNKKRLTNFENSKEKLKNENGQEQTIPEPIEIEKQNRNENQNISEKNREPVNFQAIGNFKDILKEHIDPIMVHLRSQDEKCRVQEDYFKKKQKQVDSKMREVLVDWLIEVHNRYKMRDETIFLAVRLVDKYLDMEEVEYHRFQLLGTACLMIAAKYEEIYPPKVKDFVYICANAYSREEVLSMESQVLRAMNFDLVFPTSIQFFGFFGKLWGFESVVRHLVHYILYGSLVQEAFVRTSPRLLAYSSVLMGYKAFKKSERAKEFKERFSGEFVESEVNYCIFQIYNMLLGLKKTELSALRSRFSGERYGNIAQIEARVH